MENHGKTIHDASHTIEKKKEMYMDVKLSSLDCGSNGKKNKIKKNILRITLIKDIQMNIPKSVIMKGKENLKNENEKNMNQKIKKKLSMMNLMK